MLKTSYQCYKCLHKWNSKKKEGTPKECPRCKTYLYNRKEYYEDKREVEKLLGKVKKEKELNRANVYKPEEL